MKKYLFAIFFFLIVLILSASDLPIKLFKPDTLFIGQPFDIVVKIHPSDNKKVLPPKYIDSEILNILNSSFELKDNTYTYKISIAAFDTGRVEIPPLSFYLINPSSENTKNLKMVDSLQTQSFSLWVTPSITETDTTLKDIKQPLAIHLQWQDYLLIILILYAVSLIYLFIKKIRNRKNNTLLDFVEYDNRPAWQKAFDMLNSLREQKLLSKGEWVEYHYLLSMVLRYFLLLQFNIKAIEMTTYEIKDALDENFPHKREILEILNYSDQIKFAKFIPEITISNHYETWVENYLFSFKITVTETEQPK